MIARIHENQTHNGSKDSYVKIDVENYNKIEKDTNISNGLNNSIPNDLSNKTTYDRKHLNQNP